MRSKLKCNIKGCREEHHARGYCNRHYKKLMKYSDPLQGQFKTKKQRRTSGKGKVANLQIQAAPIPQDVPKRPVAKRDPSAPHPFTVNIKIIDKLYKEIVKATHEPLYIAHNGGSVISMLSLCVKLAGYDEHNNYFLTDLIAELEEWAKHKDSLRFMSCLQTWEQRFAEFQVPPQREQLAIVFPN